MLHCSYLLKAIVCIFSFSILIGEEATVDKVELQRIDGKRQGIAKTYYPSGKIKQEANFIDDKKNGPCIHYFENGNKHIESYYINGFLTGLYKEYHENGNIKLITRYYKQKDSSKEAPAFITKNANIFTFTEIEYYDDGKTIRRKTPFAIFRVVKNLPGGVIHYDVSRVASGQEIFYKQDGSIERTYEYFNDSQNNEQIRFSRPEAETSQLIPDGSKVFALQESDSLPE